MNSGSLVIKEIFRENFYAIIFALCYTLSYLLFRRKIENQINNKRCYTELFDLMLYCYIDFILRSTPYKILMLNKKINIIFAKECKEIVPNTIVYK